ncbi:MAG TPA: VOC family protein [Solirubrobacterales bacterium]|nr:VOC family protein [Solirubrobacterales bacterium]
MTTFYPTLRYRDARAAIAWLQDAFGFEAGMVVDGEGDEVVHAQLAFGDGIVMLGSERDDRWGTRAGQGWCYVALDGDVDAHCERARTAGAEIVMEPTDQDYGSRDYAARDPEGNLWNFGTYRP